MLVTELAPNGALGPYLRSNKVGDLFTEIFPLVSLGVSEAYIPAVFVTDISDSLR